jgi:hypothetical protein
MSDSFDWMKTVPPTIYAEKQRTGMEAAIDGFPSPPHLAASTAANAASTPCNLPLAFAELPVIFRPPGTSSRFVTVKSECPSIS